MTEHARTQRRLLDLDVVAEILATVPAFADADPASLRLENFWIKPGRHFNVSYSLRRGGGTRRTTVSAFVMEADKAAHVVAKAREHTCATFGTARCLRCATAFVEPDLLVLPFPLDPRLPTLRRCVDVRRVRRSVPDLGVLACEVKAYRPGIRSLVAYRTAERGELFGKVAVEARGPGHAFTTQERLFAALRPHRDVVRIPAPVCWAADLGLALAAHEPGTSLHDLLPGARDLDAEVGGIALAIARLHGLTAAAAGVGERTFGATDEIALVRAWVELTGELLPALAPPLRKALAGLESATPGPIEPRAVLHRDFYDKQVLLDASLPPALLDLDTACAGDPELDLGNFLAHLRLRGMQHDIATRCRALEDALVGAYPRPIEAPRLDWYRRMSLLRLACNYGLRPKWRHIASAIVAEVMEVGRW